MIIVKDGAVLSNEMQNVGHEYKAFPEVGCIDSEPY